jgi:hypothetical protein
MTRQVTLAYHLWLALGESRMPHDGRDIGSREVLVWQCPMCNQVVDETKARTPCTVDWRWPLHEVRYLEALKEVGIDPYQIVTTEN